MKNKRIEKLVLINVSLVMLLNSQFVVLANDFSTYSEESIDSGLAIENLQESLISVSEEMAISSSENPIESETISSDSVVENSNSSMDSEMSSSSDVEIEFSEESVEANQYESIFYNNQWFQVPVQPETKELTINPNDNHELGSFVVGETNSRAKRDVITEKQTGRPRWDFIDVASYQSNLSVSDYEYMKKQGITGVVVKLTEGTTYKNPYAKTQIENAKKAGLKVSTYHFSRYTTKGGAEKEAEFYAKVAKELKLSSNTIMVNDLEVGLNQYSTQNSMIFSNRLKALGYSNTIHYSSAYTFSSGLLSIAMLGEKNLWVAQYPYQPTNKDILHSTRSAWQWSSTMQFTTIKGKTFDVNMDHSGLFSNSSTDIPKDEILSSISSEKIINKYGTIGNTDYIFWLDLNLQQENVNSPKYYNKTLFVEKEFTFRDGKKLFSIKDNKDNFIGYIESTAVTIASGQHGIYQNYGKYVMIKGDYAIWNGFDWAKSTSASPYKNKTVQARGIYYHFNGSSYLSLYDNQGKWIGYMNAAGANVAPGQQGIYQAYNKYVMLKGDYAIWNGFDWAKSTSAAPYKNKTVQARGIYYHFNGSSYLSLYDNQGKWIGYMNAAGANVATGQQGIYQAYNKYVMLKGDYAIWNGFDWAKSTSAAPYKNKTVQARGIYYHFNGSSYLSLYDNQGKWIGYTNAAGANVSTGQQGIYQAYNKYVMLKGDYAIWNGFDWAKNTSAAPYKNKTVQARGIYYHFNGSSYLSLYDNQGKWIGYMNAAGANVATGQQGIYQTHNKYVTVKSNSYTIWKNFGWSSKASGKFSGKTYLAKGIYRHFNGSSYLSLYDSNNKWVGYINQNGTKAGSSQQEKFKKVQDLLNKEFKNQNLGIYVMSLVDGSTAQINGNKQFHAASTGKLPALYYTQKMILEKKVDGNKLLTYTDAINQMPGAYMRGGAGVLQSQPYGKKFSLNTIMNWTAKYSDNQGTNFLAYYASNKYDAAMKKEISTIMGRNWTAPFYVNAKDNAMMLEAIYNQGGKLITDMSNTVYDNQRIPKYIPVQVAHKIGDVNDLRHDAGIIYSKEPYVLSVLTQNYQSYEKISVLSKKIYDILK